MQDINSILSLETIASLTDEEGLDAVAQLIDYASDQADIGLNAKAMTWCRQLEGRRLSDEQRIFLDYFEANAWANSNSLINAQGPAIWAWDQDAIQKQIYLLRRAVNNPGFGEIDVAIICQILTNLANQLNIGGRFIEAREIWGNALSRNSAFWMARANRGNALISYASALYDSGHQSVFALVAHSELTQAIHDLDEHPELGDTSLRPIFVEAAESITQHFDLAAIS
nr:hypothetical protein [uncultured Rhodopila sp.]